MTDRSDRKREDPTAIRSVAVTVDDVVAALEANRSANRGAVLRITPPFSGRMRARIHVAGGEGAYDGAAEPIHLDPDALVDEVPDYPTADGTAARSEGEDIEMRRQRHAERVDAWRETVRTRVNGEVTLNTESGPVDVRVITLG